MKAKNRWTHSDCTRIIKENKDKTGYYDGSLEFDYMWGLFRYRLHFGEPETACIMAALIKSGAFFK